MKKYVCSICGYIYDENTGIPNAGISPGTKWEELPEGWVCPVCKASKTAFVMEQEKTNVPAQPDANGENKREDVMLSDEKKELDFAELSALCSNLAKGSEKQYLSEEMQLFTQLSEYFEKRSGKAPDKTFEDLSGSVQKDLDSLFVQAKAAAQEEADRGALRALTWSEKVTRMMDSLLKRYEAEQGTFLQDTNVYVCDICGFIYIGDEAPEICPVCKVPKMKIRKVQRG